MSRSKSVGFTLIEVLLVLLITSILCLIGYSTLPSYRQYQNEQFVENTLLAVLRFARNQALFHQRSVQVSPLSPTHDWSLGVRVALLPLQENNYLYTVSWSYPAIQVRWQGFLSKQYLVFSPNLAEAATNGHFLLFREGVCKKKIIVNRIGRVKVQRIT
jgi:prepilin-type N-terminal cleavage/methylation domain-containing protein